MPEVAPDVVAVIGRANYGFLLDLAARLPDVVDLLHVLAHDFQAGEEHLVVHMAAVTLDLELESVAENQLAAVVDREPLGGLGELVVQQFVQVVVGTGLADKDEVPVWRPGPCWQRVWQQKRSSPK